MDIPQSARNVLFSHGIIYVLLLGFSCGMILIGAKVGFTYFVILYILIAIACFILMYNSNIRYKPIKAASDTLWNFWSLSAILGIMYNVLQGEKADFASRMLDFDPRLASIVLVGAGATAAAKLAVSAYESRVELGALKKSTSPDKSAEAAGP